MHTSVCVSALVKYTTQMSTVFSLICLGPSFQKMTQHFSLDGSLQPTNLEKNLKPWSCCGCQIYLHGILQRNYRKVTIKCIPRSLYIRTNARANSQDLDKTAPLEMHFNTAMTFEPLVQMIKYLDSLQHMLRVLLNVLQILQSLSHCGHSYFWISGMQFL